MELLDTAPGGGNTGLLPCGALNELRRAPSAGQPPGVFTARRMLLVLRSSTLAPLEVTSSSNGHFLNTEMMPCLKQDICLSEVFLWSQESVCRAGQQCLGVSAPLSNPQQ